MLNKEFHFACDAGGGTGEEKVVYRARPDVLG
jgi:hypothetical protein